MRPKRPPTQLDTTALGATSTDLARGVAASLAAARWGHRTSVTFRHRRPLDDGERDALMAGPPEVGSDRYALETSAWSCVLPPPPPPNTPPPPPTPPTQNNTKAENDAGLVC